MMTIKEFSEKYDMPIWTVRRLVRVGWLNYDLKETMIEAERRTGKKKERRKYFIKTRAFFIDEDSWLEIPAFVRKREIEKAKRLSARKNKKNEKL